LRDLDEQLRFKNGVGSARSIQDRTSQDSILALHRGLSDFFNSLLGQFRGIMYQANQAGARSRQES
jgi:hypothetical protein